MFTDFKTVSPDTILKKEPSWSSAEAEKSNQAP
jgi:hypothetical protein